MCITCANALVVIDDPSTVPFMLALHRLMQDLPLGKALVEPAGWWATTSRRGSPRLRFIALGA